MRITWVSNMKNVTQTYNKIKIILLKAKVIKSNTSIRHLEKISETFPSIQTTVRYFRIRISNRNNQKLKKLIAKRIANQVPVNSSLKNRRT